MTAFVLDENGRADGVGAGVLGAAVWLGGLLVGALGGGAAELGAAVGLELTAGLGAGELPGPERLAGADGTASVDDVVAAVSWPLAVQAATPRAIARQPATCLARVRSMPGRSSTRSA